MEELLSKFARFLSETTSVGEFLADLVSTSHGPLGDFPLNSELDVHLIVDFESTVDRFRTFAVNKLSEFACIVGIVP